MFSVVACVDQMFFLVWSRCPLIIAADCGGCFLRVVAVNPGMLGMYPFCSAFSSVLIAGEKNAACMNATILAAVFVPIAAFA